MNAVQIQDLINKIGEFKSNVDTNYYTKEDVYELELNIIKNYLSEFSQKLEIQLKESSGTNILDKLISTIDNIVEELEKIYHSYRIKFVESRNSDFKNSIPTICKIIDCKIDCLFKIKKDLQTKIIFFDCKIESDFETLVINSVNEISESQIQDEISESIADNKISINENPYPRIFVNHNAFLLFEILKKNICKVERTQLADYSFIFRKLQKDNEIYSDVAEKAFRTFLDENYKIALPKLKILDYCTTDLKQSIYNDARM